MLCGYAGKRSLKRFQMAIDNVPYDLAIDIVVPMPQNISNSLYVLPRDFGMTVLDRKRHPSGSFGNDLDAPLHSVPCFYIPLEVLKPHPACKLIYVLDGLAHLEQRQVEFALAHRTLTASLSTADLKRGLMPLQVPTWTSIPSASSRMRWIPASSTSENFVPGS